MLCNSQVINLLKLFLSCFEAEIDQGIDLLCINGGKFVEILALRKTCMQMLQQLLAKGLPVFTVGIHIARYQNGVIRPLLGLFHVLKKIEKGYVVVNERGEKLFLYGRDVFYENVIKIVKPRELPICKGRVVVRNIRGECIGWGLMMDSPAKPIIRNILDLGWYLRSGV